MPLWKFQRTVRALALIITALSFIGLTNDAIAGTLPQDPCALLKASEIQALDPGAKIGNGVPDKSAAPIAAACKYSWGPRSDKWGDTELTIAVIDASKGWPGTSFELLEEGLLMKVKAGGGNASQITGVGDAAVFSHEDRSNNATAEALLKAKDVHVSLVFHHGDPVQSKDKLTTLLKTVTGRL
jgi:hypothetical protein